MEGQDCEPGGLALRIDVPMEVARIPAAKAQAAAVEQLQLEFPAVGEGTGHVATGHGTDQESQPTVHLGLLDVATRAAQDANVELPHEALQRPPRVEEGFG